MHVACLFPPPPHTQLIDNVSTQTHCQHTNPKTTLPVPKTLPSTHTYPHTRPPTHPRTHTPPPQGNTLVKMGQFIDCPSLVSSISIVKDFMLVGTAAHSARFMRYKEDVDRVTR